MTGPAEDQRGHHSSPYASMLNVINKNNNNNNQNRYHRTNRTNSRKGGHTKNQNRETSSWQTQESWLMRHGHLSRASLRCQGPLLLLSKIGRWSIVKNVIFGAVASKCVTRLKWFLCVGCVRIRNKEIGRRWLLIWGDRPRARTGWFVARTIAKSFPFSDGQKAKWGSSRLWMPSGTNDCVYIH